MGPAAMLSQAPHAVRMRWVAREIAETRRSTAPTASGRAGASPCKQAGEAGARHTAAENDDTALRLHDNAIPRDSLGRRPATPMLSSARALFAGGSTSKSNS